MLGNAGLENARRTSRSYGVVWIMLPAEIMRISEAIQNCAAIERVIAEVYEIFATRWPGQPLGILWRELAAEGIAHGRLLEKGCSRLPPADRDDPSVNRTKLEAMRNFVIGDRVRPCSNSVRLLLRLPDCGLVFAQRVWHQPV